MGISMSETIQLWEKVLQVVEKRLDDKNIYDNFFAGSYIYSIENNTILVVVQGSLAVQLLQTKYASLLQEVVLEVTETNYKLSYVTAEEAGKKKVVAKVESQSYFKESFVNEKLTFDNFVVGESNREAGQASLLVASNPGKMFNPLFIYSDSGLGKTHLLHAVGNYIKANKVGARVVCITADDFMNEFISMVKGEKDSRALRDYCKSADVFLIDDIQFMADKTKCQELFFNIFNDLVRLEKQIVITSDRQPSELKGVEERLVTRFSQGLTVTIKEPDRDTKLAIIRKKIESDQNLSHIIWEDMALNLIADKFGKSVRELEGALHKVIYQVILKNTNKVTSELVVEAVSGIGGRYIGDEISASKVVNIVADYYNVTPSIITGNSHNRQIVLARHVAMYLIRYTLDISLKKIGEVFGGKDHTTVMAGIKNVEKMLKTDEAMQLAIKQLKDQIKK